jgi:SAM-dependent methyltransferase
MLISDQYSGAYADATYGGADGMREAFYRIVSLPSEKSDNAGRVRRVCEYAAARLGSRPAKPALLDVGAGLGVFPHAMMKAGWDVTALDPDPRNESHYRDIVCVKPVISDFLKLPAGALRRTFDVVSFNKVLEHVCDPVRMLARAADLCSAGGLVYLEVPDVTASTEGQNREEFLFGHEHVFSIASTALLLQRSGFRPLRLERLREPSGKFTIFGFGSPGTDRQ